MKITIHRGINQIGGCITEIATDKTKIMIDLGQNLPNNKGDVSDEFANEEAIEKLTANVDAVFYTHYHGDHIGLISLVPTSINQYIGVTAKEVIAVKTKYLRQNQPTLHSFKARGAITIKDIIITPFFVSHSAADSYMFLVEVAGKKILHTGDFRNHGYLGKGLKKMINAFIGQVDFLITEGTMLSRLTECVPTENELKQRVRVLMTKYKYVFVLGSSTDIDRLATFHKANLKGRLFVCDSYQKEILDVFSTNQGVYSDLYRFDDIEKFPKVHLLDDMVYKGFCMMVRINKYKGKYSKFTDLIIDKIPEEDRLLVYSMWSGYLNDGDNQKKEYVEFCGRFKNVERVHTSGHASTDCLVEVCNLTNPRMGIIPIHSENSDAFSNLPISKEHKSKIITDSVSIGNVVIQINK